MKELSERRTPGGEGVGESREIMTPPDVPMTTEHRAQLRRHYPTLLDNMNTKYVLPVLVSFGVLTPAMEDDILHAGSGTRRDIARELLEMLPTMGDRAFAALCLGLRQGCKQAYLADMLETLPKPKRMSSTNTESSLKNKDEVIDMGLEIQVKKKDEVIKSLEAKLRHTSEQLEALQQARIQNQEDRDVTAKAALLKDLQEELAHKKREYEELKLRFLNLRTKFKKYKEEKESAVKRLEKECRDVRILKDNHATKAAKLDRENADLTLQLAEATRDLQDSNNARTRTEEKFQALKKERDDLFVKASAAEKAARIAQSRQQTVETEKEEVERHLAQVAAERDDLEKDKRDLEHILKHIIDQHGVSEKDDNPLAARKLVMQRRDGARHGRQNMSNRKRQIDAENGRRVVIERAFKKETVDNKNKFADLLRKKNP
ncbi:Hypp1250 [Branchiostoma lanceolatum]|uniref:Hypp1250 protein n=1 Tax=Branchiostoma lanceolatum TaxID=7740 RepID=A0A8K0EMN3_BRALA|nr:Hypp1250 [Branchiostoma lanceolatum]